MLYHRNSAYEWNPGPLPDPRGYAQYLGPSATTCGTTLGRWVQIPPTTSAFLNLSGPKRKTEAGTRSRRTTPIRKIMDDMKKGGKAESASNWAGWTWMAMAGKTWCCGRYDRQSGFEDRHLYLPARR